MSDWFAEGLSQGWKVATADQMREFDRRAVEEYGVPSIVLMENAGRHVFEAVREQLCYVHGKRVAVIAGKGNNGGDGFVVARHLRNAGAEVSVFLLGTPEDVKGDAKVNLDILLKTGLTVVSLESSHALKMPLAHSHVVVDAIFGTGLKGEVRGLAADAIQAINSSGRTVIAVDIPSGLDADTGQIWGGCVKADVTVTFALPKVGVLTYPGAAYAGKLVVGEIGIPHQLYDEISVELTGREWVAEHLPKRPESANKGTFGTGVVIAGSAGMTGAATLASEAVLRIGAGLSILGVPPGLQPVMAAKLTEVMPRALQYEGSPVGDIFWIRPDMLKHAIELCQKATSIVLGCGIGAREETCSFVCDFISQSRKPMVVDADGLNCLSKNLSYLEGEHGEMVITPHPGEMARLLGTTTDDIQSNRMYAAREASSRFHCVTVLKGARTLVADPTGRVLINPTGNAGLATGGTGDVLAGTIGGLLAQGLSPLDAAVCGVYVHGLAGDIAADSVGEVGMLASEVLSSLPEALRLVKGSRYPGF